jgi:hypothetical protein
VVRANPTQYHWNVDDPTLYDRCAAEPTADDRAIRMIER